MFLAGDIGGTKTELGLFDNAGQLIFAKHYINATADNFTQILQAYIAELPCDNRPQIDAACLGIAGPIREQKCQMTNLPWFIDASQISTLFGFHCVLMNDLAAFAWSIPWLSADNYLQLQEGSGSAKGPVAVLSVGTGLGQAALLPMENTYHVIASEGGHKDFAPHNIADANLLIKELKHNDQRPVSVEHLVSGPGLPRMLAHIAGDDSLIQLASHPDYATQGATAIIIEKGLRSPDSEFGEALKRFAMLVAHEASNLALQYVAEGGVVIGGGIPPRFVPLFNSMAFREHFADKSAHQDWLRKRSIKLCINTRAPLWGGYYYLRSTNSW